MNKEELIFKNLLLKSINQFVNWLEKNGSTSYDQYDFWNTKYGKFAKKIYYLNRIFGGFLVAPIFVLEIIFPSSRKLFVKRKRFPIADAHLILGFINLYNYTQNDTYLENAKEIGEELLKTSINGFSGYCWGYPFDWMTNRGLWEKSTPLITTTPYCFEAYLALYDETGNKRYFEIALSIYNFAINDIHNNIINETEVASSYSPIDRSKVINASSYRAFLLVEGFNRFHNEETEVLANKLINFILKNQNKNGSWLYAIENRQDAFIDNFHTCFVLKNLYKCNKVLKRKEVNNAIIKGYSFYKNNLLTSDFRPKPFAYSSRLNIVKEEIYDYAEGISLGILLQDLIPKSISISIKMSETLILNYQTRYGYFITKVMVLGFNNKIPYLRWPQSQLFFALSKLLQYQNKL